MTAVEVCPICDIAGCRHIRERKAKMTEEEPVATILVCRNKAACRRAQQVFPNMRCVTPKIEELSGITPDMIVVMPDVDLNMSIASYGTLDNILRMRLLRHSDLSERLVRL